MSFFHSFLIDVQSAQALAANNNESKLNHMNNLHSQYWQVS